MFTPAQLTQIYDYIKYCKFEAARKAREAEELEDTHVVTEQTRREKELTRLERAIETEMTAAYGALKGSVTGCPEETPNRPTAKAANAKGAKGRKRSAKKSKTRADGSCTTAGSANGAKPKRGRPRTIK